MRIIVPPPPLVMLRSRSLCNCSRLQSTYGTTVTDAIPEALL